MNIKEFKEKYNFRADSIPTKPGCWDFLKVTILQQEKAGGVIYDKIGEYQRSYRCMYNTFVPFRQRKNGQIKEYALYSDEYTRSAVMSLPDCKQIVAEENHAWGFCPVDFYVPFEDEKDYCGLDGMFGFVAGCVWGDDTSWKIQYLDLSEIDQGIIKREERFGYIEMPRGLSLEDSISLDCYYKGDIDGKYYEELEIQIATPLTFNIETGEILCKCYLSDLLKDEEEVDKESHEKEESS